MASKSEALTIDELWEKLSEYVQYIFQFQTIRYSKWMFAYTYIFDYCTNNQSNVELLYKKIEDYFEDYVQRILLVQLTDDLRDEIILESYANSHEKYRRSSRIFHGICSYMHRHYIKHEREFNRTGTDEIYALAMNCWNRMIAPLFHKRIARICLNMIKIERENQLIDTKLIKQIIQILISPHTNNLDEYQEHFERDYLRETQEFYQLESIQYLQQNSIIDYLSKINEYIDVETHRVTTYLHPSTYFKVIQALEQVLIRDQLETLCEEAKKFIKNENISNINLLYQTVNRIENGKHPLKTLLENHISQISHSKIDSLRVTHNHDLNKYVKILAELHEKYLQFIRTAFDNDNEFIQVLDRTFEKIVNDNSIVRTIRNTSTMAKVLAHFCNKHLVRKRHIDDIDYERLFDQIKILLTYIDDKDVFSKFYLRFLAKRLINNTSISNDYEKLMITNIETACGFEYASKLKQIYQDAGTSQDLLNQYSNIDSKVHLNILIFNSKVWPLPTADSVCLHQQLRNIAQDFSQFYIQMCQGKKLTWLHRYSYGELQGYFQKKFYIFRVSIYEMTVLLLFNDTLKLTIEQIQDRTQIKIDLLIQILNSLVNLKIFTSNYEINLNSINMNSSIRLAENFYSERSRINLNFPIRSNEEFEDNFVSKTINHDRIIIIRAAIVRILKQHQRLNEKLLIQYVIEQIKSRFSCQVSVIKNCIETLMNEDYFERDVNHSDEFVYKN